jgi:hypothetical protein
MWASWADLMHCVFGCVLKWSLGVTSLVNENVNVNANANAMGLFLESFQFSAQLATHFYLNLLDAR